jgi:hypothetical protein
VSRALLLGETRLTRLQSKSKKTGFLEPGLESPRRGAECEWQTRSLCRLSAPAHGSRHPPACDSLLGLYDKPPAAKHIFLRYFRQRQIGTGVLIEFLTRCGFAKGSS